MTLSKATGHPCPKCGCRDGIEHPFSTTRNHRRCAHCGHRWYCPKTPPGPDPTPRPAPQAPPEDRGNGTPTLWYIPAVQPLCPGCESANTKVVRTVRPTRYHKCENCGRRYKTIEKAG